MLFNSLEFIYLFLPVTLGLFYLASHYRLLKLCKYILLVASLFFYGYWKASYFALIIISILTNYTVAVILEKYRHKSVLISGICFNLGLLGYFKYLTFAMDNLRHIFPLTPMSVETAIPLGISFYTFQQMTYIIDVYQRKTKTFSLSDYALFVTFWPQLIAGPILHYLQIMPQLARARTYVLRHKNLFIGFFLFLTGLFQKVVIADFLNPLADTGFRNAGLLGFVEAWSALLAYSLQIYFDFAGYSNMAIGLGVMCNVQIPMNFNSPYQAVSIIDFWRRWHMTLSHFLKDYVYVPLGGNRKGKSRRYLNIFLTMLIGGFWHGGGWTFVIWGGYHGMLLILNHLADDAGIEIPKLWGRLSTFLLATYGWVFFKSVDLHQAMEMTRGLLGIRGLGLADTPFLWKHQLIGLAIALGIALLLPNAKAWSRKVVPNWRWGLVMTGMLLVNLLYLNRESAFLYFQF